MVEIDEKLEISVIQLPEEDGEIEIIFEETEIESCLDSESDFLDSIPQLLFIDEGSIKILETASSSTLVVTSTENSNQYECSVCQEKTYRIKPAFLKHVEL